MRPLLAMSLFACMLCLTGCNLPKRWKGDSSRGSGSGSGQPFLGSPSSDSTPTPASDTSQDTLASGKGKAPGRGTLAGSVLDNAGRRVPRAIVKFIETDPPREGIAPLSTKTDSAGYFDMPGLDVGRWYRVVARVPDGNRVLIGHVRVKCPNVRVVIPLTGEEVPDKSGIAKPGKGDEKQQASPAAASGGSAVILAPVPHLKQPSSEDKPAPAPVPFEKAMPSPAPPRPQPVQVPGLAPPGGHDPSLIARDRQKKGFERAPNVNVPGPVKKEKPLTPAPPMSDPELKPSSAPSAAPPSLPVSDDVPKFEANAAPRIRQVVPSCVRLGSRIDTFTLYDFDGKVWDLKKHRRRGRLILLDFWSSKCMPCRAALPWLVKLDRKYRSFGLDVVGIANERPGTLAEKQDAVRAIRAQMHISYPILFTGGGERGCPVMRQLEIDSLPTLILVDERGQMVWRTSGVDSNMEYRLEMDIRRRLGLPLR